MPDKRYPVAKPLARPRQAAYAAVSGWTTASISSTVRALSGSMVNSKLLPKVGSISCQARAIWGDLPEPGLGRLGPLPPLPPSAQAGWPLTGEPPHDGSFPPQSANNGQ